MRDQGVYLQLWKKYIPVIRLLLKKTGSGEQKLQLYKHEFEKTGARNKLGHLFSLHIVKGKAVNNTHKKAASHDLYMAMTEDQVIATLLSDQDITMTMNKSCELVMKRAEIAAPVAVVEAVV